MYLAQTDEVDLLVDCLFDQIDVDSRGVLLDIEELLISSKDGGLLDSLLLDEVVPARQRKYYQGGGSPLDDTYLAGVFGVRAGAAEDDEFVDGEPFGLLVLDDAAGASKRVGWDSY